MDLAHLLQSRPSAEKLEPWQEAWVEQLVSTIFLMAPGGNNSAMQEMARSQMVGWVKERTVEDARETAQSMMATAKRLLELLPERTVEYPSLPGSKVEA